MSEHPNWIESPVDPDRPPHAEYVYAVGRLAGSARLALTCRLTLRATPASRKPLLFEGGWLWEWWVHLGRQSALVGGSSGRLAAPPFEAAEKSLAWMAGNLTDLKES